VTSVKRSVTELEETEATARFVTLPGFVTAVTVIAAVPLFPSLAAVIVADPAATAVTRPLDDTVAMAALLDVHVTVRPVNVLPAASFNVAASCRVVPAARLAVAGLRATVATGATAAAAVVALATFDSAPNTASTFSVPRNDTSWN